MGDNRAPLFRKAGRGYNKEDVNAYILSLSRECQRLQSSNAALETELDSLRRFVSEANSAAAAATAQQEKTAAEANALSERVSSLYDENRNLTEENLFLKSELEAVKAECEQVRDTYSKVCSKAGEILAMAGDAADDILNRAGGKAHEIIDDAKAKKDVMFRTITATADDFSEDIESYIKLATRDCMDKINDSIASIENSVGGKKIISSVKDSASVSSDESRHGRIVFVNGE